MRIESRNVGKVVVVTLLDPRLGADAAPQFKADVGRYLSEGNNKLVLDLQKVTFVDSTGLGALVSLRKMAGDHGEVAVAGLQEPVRALFELTRLEKVFRFYSTSAEALEALTAEAVHT